MKVVIAGGTGFLGRPLCDLYAEAGDEVIVLTRGLRPGDAAHDPGTGVPGVTRVGWQPDGGTGSWAKWLEGADAVLNLAGASIGDGRWTPDRKARLRASRILATESLAAATLAAARPPRVFVSASAVGYYGFAQGARVLDESATPGDDFMARLCVDWERAAVRPARAETRVVIIRAGLVLERDGGALPRMLPPYWWFVGGPLGSGQQYVSWIHRLDWLELVRWAVGTPSVFGPINATAPAPVTNAAFSRALGHALHRPSWLPAPTFALRLLLGEMADALLLGGQRVVPKRTLELGFEFRYPEIERAFRDIFETG